MPSGATVMVFGDVAVKVAEGYKGSRVGQQGRWLRSHNDITCLPYVYAVWHDGYAMETLVPAPNEPAFLEFIAVMLEDSVWLREARVEWNTRKHLDYAFSMMTGLPGLYDRFSEPLAELFAVVQTLSLRECRTHGDPTLDNLMMRRRAELDERYVITDPIPARPEVPDLLAVDLGKMLQSAYGYEIILEGGNVSDCVEPREFTAWIHKTYGDEEALAARYWCAYHFLRLLRYVDPEVRGGMEVLLERVLGL